MAKWQLATSDWNATRWNDALAKASDYTVFQSWGWGELKRPAGWAPLRWIATDKSGRTVAMAQTLVKRMPLGVAVAWAPGGPVLQFPGGHDIDACDLPGLIAALKQQAPRILARFDSYIPREPHLAYALNRTLARPCTRLSSGFSITFDLSQPGGSFADGIRSKHRYYVRKADAAGIRWEDDCSERGSQALVSLHREMAESKGLAARPMTAEHCTALHEALDGGMTIFTGYIGERPVASCLTLDFGKKSFYYIAASGKDGRTIGASYAMIPRLVEALRAKDIEHLDFGGIAPASPQAAGVDHFKKGFGGRIVEYLGEWEWSSTPLLASAVGLMMKRKGMAA